METLTEFLRLLFSAFSTGVVQPVLSELSRRFRPKEASGEHGSTGCLSGEQESKKTDLTRRFHAILLPFADKRHWLFQGGTDDHRMPEKLVIRWPLTVAFLTVPTNFFLLPCRLYSAL